MVVSCRRKWSYLRHINKTDVHRRGRYRSFKIGDDTVCSGMHPARTSNARKKVGKPPGSRRCALDTETHRAFGSEKESFPDVTTRPGCRQWLFYTPHEWDYTLVDKSLAPFRDYVRGRNSAPWWFRSANVICMRCRYAKKIHLLGFIRNDKSMLQIN